MTSQCKTSVVTRKRNEMRQKRNNNIQGSVFSIQKKLFSRILSLSLFLYDKNELYFRSFDWSTDQIDQSNRYRVTKSWTQRINLSFFSNDTKIQSNDCLKVFFDCLESQYFFYSTFPQEFQPINQLEMIDQIGQLIDWLDCFDIFFRTTSLVTGRETWIQLVNKSINKSVNKSSIQFQYNLQFLWNSPTHNVNNV